MADEQRGIEARVADLEARLAWAVAVLAPLLVGRRVAYSAERRIRDFSHLSHTDHHLTGSVARVVSGDRVEVTGDDGGVDVVSVFVVRPY